MWSASSRTARRGELPRPRPTPTRAHGPHREDRWVPQLPPPGATRPPALPDSRTGPLPGDRRAGSHRPQPGFEGVEVKAPRVEAPEVRAGPDRDADTVASSAPEAAEAPTTPDSLDAATAAPERAPSGAAPPDAPAPALARSEEVPPQVEAPRSEEVEPQPAPAASVAPPDTPEVHRPDAPGTEALVPALEDTSLEAWAAPAESEAPAAPEPAAAAVPPAAKERDVVPLPAPPPEQRAAAAAAHPPLDDLEVPELVVTEFKGPGRLRPAGLEHTPASADVHAAITPPAGTLIVTELDEPPPEQQPRFQLDAPVRGDEPLHPPESSFHDVEHALGPTTPIPLLPTMETASLDEVPIPPPPPPLDVAPVPEEGAVRLEPAPAEPPQTPVSARPLETRRDLGPSRRLRRGARLSVRPSLSPHRRRAPRLPERPSSASRLTLSRSGSRWFHDGRAEPLLLDPARGRADAPVRLVREPGAPPRMLPPDAPDPALWVGAPLSFLGLRADSDASRTVARRWPSVVVADDRGEAAFALEGGAVGAAELVAALLRWVRHRSEELTGHPPGRVVITVPVAFNALQRERLREAAERAGFEGVRLVQVPTAATMAFAHGRGLARRRILVWRMGASTCDIAVLAASGDDLDMVACAGDAALGSVNFDEQIALALDKGARADAGVLRKRIAEAAQLRIAAGGRLALRGDRRGHPADPSRAGGPDGGAGRARGAARP